MCSVCNVYTSRNIAEIGAVSMEILKCENPMDFSLKKYMFFSFSIW